MLSFVKGHDPTMGQLKRGYCVRIAGVQRPINVSRADPQSNLGQIDAIKLARITNERGVALSDHVRNDSLHQLIDVLVHPPFLGDERLE